MKSLRVCCTSPNSFTMPRLLLRQSGRKIDIENTLVLGSCVVGYCMNEDQRKNVHASMYLDRPCSYA